MKRILEKSPVVGYQLFRYEGKRGDGTAIMYPNYYVRHAGLTVCTGTQKLAEAKTKVKKMAGEDVQQRMRLTAPTRDLYVATILDLVTEDYQAERPEDDRRRPPEDRQWSTAVFRRHARGACGQ